MSRFNLGDQIRFTDTVQFERMPDGTTTHTSAGLPKVVSGTGLATVDTGIIFGSRTLMDRAITTDTVGGEGMFDPPSYETVSRPIRGTARQAWLVAYRLRRKPVIVLDTDAQLLEDS